MNCYVGIEHTLFDYSYFVVEDHILSTTSGLINQTYLDELWDTALSKITAVLRTHIVSNYLSSFHVLIFLLMSHGCTVV